MPATQTVELVDGLKAEVKPVDGQDTVFFTDQRQEFEICLTNNSNVSYVGPVRWTIAIGSGRPEPLYTGRYQIQLETGEQVSKVVGGQLLALEGHGIFGVHIASASGPEGVQWMDLNPNDEYRPAYTFTVWDRSHYESVHERPKQLQRWVVRLSALTALLAIIQVVFAITQVL